MSSTTTAAPPELTLEQVEERALQLVNKGQTDAYQIGWLYNYVVDSGLAPKAGFKDARDFFKQRVQVLSQAVLSTYGAVARTFPEPISVRYGVTKLYTLLTYAKLASLTVTPEDPSSTPIALPQKDGTTVTRPFVGCSVEEMRQAVRHKRAPAVPISEPDEIRIQRVRDSLARRFPEKHSIRVDARMHLGKLFLTLRDIPEEEVARVAAALLDKPSAEAPASPSAGLAAGEGRLELPTPPAPVQSAGPVREGPGTLPSPAGVEAPAPRPVPVLPQPPAPHVEAPALRPVPVPSQPPAPSPVPVQQQAPNPTPPGTVVPLPLREAGAQGANAVAGRAVAGLGRMLRRSLQRVTGT